jgi:hypothetical protein
MAFWAAVTGLLVAGILAASHELVIVLQGWFGGWGPQRH